MSPQGARMKTGGQWATKQLKWVLRLAYGDALPTDNRADGDVDVYGSNGVVGKHDVRNTACPAVIVGRKGSFGKVTFAAQGGFCIDTAFYTDARYTDCNLRWVYWILQALRLDEISEDTGVPGLSREHAHTQRLLVPPLRLQATIAASLDRETTRIDALIEKKTRFIELLREKRQALITQAVTRGLDPGVPKGDSGFEWIGDIPAHWRMRPLKLLVKPGSSVTYGIVQPGEAQDEGVPFVQTTNISKGDFALDRLQRTTPEIEAAYPRSRLSGGEVILGIRASIGSAYLVPAELRGANLSRGVARIDCADEVLPSYLVQYLRSHAVAVYWDLSRQGSTFNEVSIETVRNLPVTVPPLEEQTRIVDECNDGCERLQRLLDATERSTSLLRERRAAIITAAVTGQIDVHEAA